MTTQTTSNPNIVAILESNDGKQRDVIFKDGSVITMFYCQSMKTWVTIPE